MSNCDLSSHAQYDGTPSLEYFSVLLQASSQGPPVSAAVYAAAGMGSAPFVRRRCDCLAEFGAVYKYSDLLTYLPHLTVNVTLPYNHNSNVA